MRALLLSEKPSLGRTIEAVYSKIKNEFPDEIDVAYLVGHVVGLKEPREYGIEEWAGNWNFEILPMIPEQFKYKVTNVSVFNDLKRKLETGNYDYLINACDPEREGNHIFQLFYMYTGCKLPCKRFWSNELTDDRIKYALFNLRHDNDGLKPNLKNLTNAALLRARFDWLVGMNFTVAGSVASKQTSKIGRVKTPTLSILGMREDEIANFKATTRYELDALYKENFSGTLFNDDGNISFDSPNGFNDIKNKLGKTAIVSFVEKKQEKTNPPNLYNLTSLKSDCSKEFGYEIDITDKIAQSLYEKKLMSYPRTDCTKVGTEIAKQFNELLNTIKSFEEISSHVSKISPNDIASVSRNKNYVDDAALEEGGHYALIPTNLKPNWNQLPKEEQNVLGLVYKRFAAIFLPPVVADKVQTITNNNGYTFKSSGKCIVDKGWQVLYNVESKDTMLPPLSKGDVVNVDKFDVKEKTTKPPKRYTDADLGLIMENPTKFLEDAGYKNIIKSKKGIGTESTRTDIIKELVRNEYIEMKSGKGKTKFIYVTPSGMSLYHNFMNFDFAKVDMTGYWETKLGEVEAGTITPQQFDVAMRNYVVSGIDKIKNSNDIKKVSFQDLAEPIGVCPVCETGNVVEGKNYYTCQNYKNGCDFIFAKDIYGAKISKTEAKKIISKKKTKEFTIIIKDKTTGKPIELKKCLMYNPDTKRVEFAKNTQKGGTQYDAKGEQIGACLQCGNPIIYHGSHVKCEAEEGACGWFMSSNIKGANITKEDFISLLNMDAIKKTFTWNAKSSSEAGMKLQKKDGKIGIEFIFPQKK